MRERRADDEDTENSGIGPARPDPAYEPDRMQWLLCSAGGSEEAGADALASDVGIDYVAVEHNGSRSSSGAGRVSGHVG